MTLFDLPSDVEPGPGPFEHESVDARRTRRNNNLLIRGTHPATRLHLLDAEWGFTCGECTHAVVIEGSRRYWKCAVGRLGLSASAASDIRKRWPACTLFRTE